MIDVAESISSFSQASPSDQLITLTIGQLQDLIKQTVTEAIAPLESKIDTLEAHIATQEQEITSLKENWKEAKPATTASRVDDLFDWVKELDARTTAQPEPQPTQRDRGDILRALLATNDGKMLESVAMKKMGLSKQTFSALLRTVPEIAVKPYHKDRRKNLLLLKQVN